MKRLLVALMLLSACREEAAQDVTALDLTPETTGFYCQMNLLEHPGPKAQAHLEGMPGMPLFFSQVRDGIAFTRMPEKLAPLLVLYVNDMGRQGATWEEPGPGNWIRADDAWYVLGSGRQGGMGAPETVPFADEAAARAFAAAEGGEVMRLDAIPDAAVIAPVGAGADDAPDPEFENRLRALPGGHNNDH